MFLASKGRRYGQEHRGKNEDRDGPLTHFCNLITTTVAYATTIVSVDAIPGPELFEDAQVEDEWPPRMPGFDLRSARAHPVLRSRKSCGGHAPFFGDKKRSQTPVVLAPP